MNINPPADIRFNLIFKREFYKNMKGGNIFPLPFTAEKRYFENDIFNKKDIDLMFLANINGDALRESINQILLTYKNENFYIGSTGERAYKRSFFFNSANPLPTPKYRNILNRSKIGINVMGAGYDCARYWEILASKSCLLTQKLGITIPNPLIEDEHCVTFETLSEFEDKLNYLLKNPKRAEEIALAGHDHLLNYHTTKKRAEYFLDIVLNYLPNKN